MANFGEINNNTPVDNNLVGLGNVDNTSDLDKPISNAMQDALDLKVNNTGDETISGNKTFTGDITANSFSGDGSGLTNIIPEAQTTQSILIAGEDLIAGNALRLGRGLVVERLYTDDGGATGTVQSTSEFYQTFTPNEGGILRNGEILLKTYSAGSTDVYLELYDSLGNLVGTSDTITLTSVQYYTYTFPGTINLTKGETYKIQFRIVSGDSLYYNYIDDSYSGGIFSYDNTKDLLMDFYIDLTEDIGKAFKTDASNVNKINFIGFANETVTSGNALKVNISGVDSNQSGLIIGSNYYLSNTSGIISATPGTNNKLCGKAISDTYIIVNIFN